MIDIQPVAIVTAASRGMGAASPRLSACGYRLALLARAEDVMVLAAELGGLGVIGSVTEEADLRRLVELTLARYGRVDAVVNNTGHSAKGEILGVTDDDWHGGLDLMLLNVVRMARLVTPAMLAQGSGAFANISSYAAFGRDGVPGLGHAARGVGQLHRALLPALCRGRATDEQRAARPDRHLPGRRG